VKAAGGPVNSHALLAQEYRKDVRDHLARARRARDRGDIEEARWQLSRAKLWRVCAHYWAWRARQPQVNSAPSAQQQSTGERQ
jgi:hypothetical protein